MTVLSPPASDSLLVSVLPDLGSFLIEEIEAIRREFQCLPAPKSVPFLPYLNHAQRSPPLEGKVHGLVLSLLLGSGSCYLSSAKEAVPAAASVCSGLISVPLGGSLPSACCYFCHLQEQPSLGPSRRCPLLLLHSLAPVQHYFSDACSVLATPTSSVSPDRTQGSFPSIPPLRLLLSITLTSGCQNHMALLSLCAGALAAPS